MRKFYFLFLGVFISACGVGTLKQDSGFGDIRAAFANRSSSESPPVDPRDVLTRDVINAAGIPLILVDIPSRQQSGTMTRLQVSTNGEYWIGADGSSLRFENGSLVESRGMGHDLIKATPMIQNVDGKDFHTRHWQYLDGFNREIVVSATCSISQKDTQIFENIGRKYNSLLIEETCVSRDHSFVNKYWIASNGLVSKSVQWHSAAVGFMTITRLY